MKIPCKRMAMYGDCAFGNGCKFTHYTPVMLEQLKQAGKYCCIYLPTIIKR